MSVGYAHGSSPTQPGLNVNVSRDVLKSVSLTSFSISFPFLGHIWFFPPLLISQSLLFCFTLSSLFIPVSPFLHLFISCSHPSPSFHPLSLQTPSHVLFPILSFIGPVSISISPSFSSWLLFCVITLPFPSLTF